MPAEETTMEECVSWRRTYDVPSATKEGVFYKVTLAGPEWASCSCPGFEYRQKCRHLRDFNQLVDACLWHQQFSDDVTQETPGVCPRCGEATIVVRVTV